MCSGSKRKVSTAEEVMESELYKKDSIVDGKNSSLLLELSAKDDIISFKHAVENEGFDIDEPCLWYGRRIGSKKMGFEERTPLMIAAMFGSKEILNYILQTGRVDVNRASGSDGATALHCAAASGSVCSHEVIQLLVDSFADVNLVDGNGNRPCDVLVSSFGFTSKPKRLNSTTLCNPGSEEGMMYTTSSELKGRAQEMPVNKGGDQGEDSWDQIAGLSPKSSSDGSGSERKEYAVDPSLPDIKNGIYGTDEFRMYIFKVKPCSRAYSHDWTECPFVHPGENARRRDPRKYHYSCVPCPEFRKGACPRGDACEYAHGIFECWLHPAQYRTRLCKDETNCTRRVCFFAHKVEELRPLYASTGSAVPSPRSYSSSGPSFDMGSLTPLTLGSPSMLIPSSSTPPMTPRLKAALNARDLELELAGLSLSPRLGVHPLSSPTGIQIRQSMNPHQLLPSYPSGMPSSPRGSSFVLEPRSSSLVLEPSGSPVSNPRLAAFATRSQSFKDRNPVNRLSNAGVMPSHLSDWSSPDGKLDWGVQGDELIKLRKSASFAYRSINGGNPSSTRAAIDEPDVSWVHYLVKEGPPAQSAHFGFDEQLKEQYLNYQMYMEPEPMVA